jgi:glycyl-tRNA synthetase beta chain
MTRSGRPERMAQELLIEVGCEEIPASWLPGLTAQMKALVAKGLDNAHLVHGGAIGSYSTPRRLTCVADAVAGRQADLEELVTGPPVSAAFTVEGAPTPAAVGFARKHGVDVSALERHETAKGVYLAHRVRQSGHSAVEVLPALLGGLLRGLVFPKQMRWDAYLDDGRGELLFGRPIRWLVLLYDGEPVPFVIRRSEAARSAGVNEVSAAARTYGHRFMAPSGGSAAAAGVVVRDFADYRARLLEHHVVLDRVERAARIQEGLDAGARALGGRVSDFVTTDSALLREVPDLVEWPSVVAGRFPEEFLALPREVLTTTMIHHQHYFPVVDGAGALTAGFLAVTNGEVADPEIIARNSERVLTARLRDASFFWEADRATALETRVAKLSAVIFHKALGSYLEKAERVGSLAAWIATEAFGLPDIAGYARDAGRLCKADLATDMVKELTELQGTMGGIYAREDGCPELVWKAISYHYLPTGVEVDAPPTREQLGGAATTWAAVSLADKLDSVVGMFIAGERPTGSRDPLGLRRQTQGAVKILADLPALTGMSHRLMIGPLLERAAEPYGGLGEAREAACEFVADRLTFLLERRGFDVRSVRAVVHGEVVRVSPLEAVRTLEALRRLAGSEALQEVAHLLKRVKNITREIGEPSQLAEVSPLLAEPAEQALASELATRSPRVRQAIEAGDHDTALGEIAALGPAVATFFNEILVNAEDQAVRAARLALVAIVRDLVLQLADLSEIVAEAK